MRKKLWKRAVAVCCTGLMLCSGLTGCGGGRDKDAVLNDPSIEDTKNLYIMHSEGGYGSAWLTAIAKAFEEEHEGVTVHIDIVKQMAPIDSDIKNYKNSNVDIYMGRDYGGILNAMNSYKTAYNGKQAFRDLTEVYNTKIPGEDVTLGEKLNASIKSEMAVEGRGTEDTSDDKFYSVPICNSTFGLFYNETVIDNALGKGNWELPRTTDEFLALCKRLKAKDAYIMLPGLLDQWTAACYNPWWAQYEGLDNYFKFFEGIGYDTNKNRETTYSNLIFKQPGRLAAAEACYDFIGYDNGLIIKNAVEIGANNLNDYQTKFTLSKYKYAFYPCGDWLPQELEDSSNTDIASDSVIKMMKTPVLSSIINSTNSYSSDQAKRLPNITSDAVLAQVIDYVDGNGSLPAGVTEEEAAFVSDARHMVGSMAENMIMYAPEYSNAKKLANEFMLFMASDKAIQLYKDNCSGSFSAFKYEYDNSKLTTIEQSISEVNKDAIFIDDFHFNELFTAGSVRSSAPEISTMLDTAMCQPGGINGKQHYEKMIEVYNDKVWDNILTKIQK